MRYDMHQFWYYCHDAYYMPEGECCLDDRIEDIVESK